MPLEDDEPMLLQRSKAPTVACRLCWADKNRTHYAGDGTLRHDLKIQHEPIYEEPSGNTDLNG